MSRRDDFLLLLQTLVLQLRPTIKIGLNVMVEAMKLPNEAIPEDVGKAAIELWEHHNNSRKVPEWLAVYRAQKAQEEYETKDAVTIRLNPESDADQWWMSAESCAESMPRQCLDIVCGRAVHSIQVPRRVALNFAEWGAGIPGWDSAPFLFLNADGSQAFTS